MLVAVVVFVGFRSQTILVIFGGLKFTVKLLFSRSDIYGEELSGFEYDF